MSIEDILRKAEVRSRSCPLSANAQYLYVNGHLTYEQLVQIQAGEEIRLTEEMKEQNKAAILLPTEPQEDFHVPVSIVEDLQRTIHKGKAIDYSAVMKRCAECIDNTLSILMPNQIDHVVIIAKREKKADFHFHEHPRYKVIIRLIDIKRQTTQILGTDVAVPLLYCADVDDKKFWEYFSELVTQQFQALTIQLIKAIKTESLDKIGK